MASTPPVADYQRQVNQALDDMDERLHRYPIVAQISSQAQVRPAYLAVGLVLFFVLFIFYGFGGRLVANLVGFAYPLYESFQSLKRKPQPGQVDEEDTQWLTYWVTYSMFTLSESFSDFLFNWIPLYHLVKIAFLLWMMAPQTKGAIYLYHTIIEPVLVRYEGDIDASEARVSKSASEVARDFADAGSAAIEAKKRQVVDDAINSLVGGGPRATGVPGDHSREHSKEM